MVCWRHGAEAAGFDLGQAFLCRTGQDCANPFHIESGSLRLRAIAARGCDQGGDKSGEAPRKVDAPYQPARKSGLGKAIAKQQAAAAPAGLARAKKAAKKKLGPKGTSKGVGLKKAAAAKALRTGRKTPRAPIRKRRDG